ncbi:GATA type zinc finger protein asd-4-like isoform X2 [Micropterus salmoides]|nr:GATA type zinc finger protein asd-4-like isoform X2 [Micropterus salmoides]
MASSMIGDVIGFFSHVYNLIKQIHSTRPKVHKERVQRLKSRISVLHEQLQKVKDVRSDSVHLQQTRVQLEEVLQDALNLMRKMEDVGWIKRVVKNSSIDSDFADLNQRLSQESLSLVLSLNIDALAMQQTFSEDRRKAEDEKDRAADMKFLEEMKETLLSVKDNVEEIKGIVIETNNMMKDLKAEQSNAPASPEQETPPAPLKAQAPPPIQAFQQAPAYTPARPQVYQQAPAYTPAPPQVYQQAPAYTPAPTQVYQQAPAYTPAPTQVYQQAPAYTPAPTQVYQQAPAYTPAPPQVYQQSPVLQPMPEFQQQQTQVVIGSGDLGDVPTMTTCQHCGERVQTRVVYHSGAFAWLICGLCVVFGMVFGCCIIPFFMDSCKDAHHFCSKCNVQLCVHKRM